MPLSKPEPRQHLHTRDIQCRGYQRADGLWDIEGAIVDTKTYAFDNVDRGGVSAGEPVHHMVVRLTVDDGLVIREAQAATEAAPYGICGDIAPAVEALVGATIKPGWRREVVKRLGGVKGCTHIRDLLIGPVAVTAHQTIAAARQIRKAVSPETGEPRQLDTCHAYDRHGPVVERLWPEFFEKA